MQSRSRGKTNNGINLRTNQNTKMVVVTLKTTISVHWERRAYQNQPFRQVH